MGDDGVDARQCGQEAPNVVPDAENGVKLLAGEVVQWRRALLDEWVEHRRHGVRSPCLLQGKVSGSDPKIGWIGVPILLRWAAARDYGPNRRGTTVLEDAVWNSFVAKYNRKVNQRLCSCQNWRWYQHNHASTEFQTSQTLDVDKEWSLSFSRLVNQAPQLWL